MHYSKPTVLKIQYNMLLYELKNGESAKVLNVDRKTPIRNRLLKIGLTEGVTITMVRVAPLGDPVEISLRNFSLALRKSTAKFITVEKL